MKNFYILLLYLILFGCKSIRTQYSLPNKFYVIPPGTIQISENLFVDKTEVCNFSYLEFYYWTKRVYGDSSEQIRDILIDETVWHDYKNYTPLIVYYLHHPTYKNHPLVGITKKQAELYCKWRSDRVMEYLLIREGVIEHNPVPNTDNYFSIEKYFTGKYNGIKPDEHFLYYPEYTLPDTSLYYQIENVAK